MPRLTARFELPISAPCLINWPVGEQPSISVDVGEFHADIVLLPDDSWRTKGAGEEHWTTGIEMILVSVSQDDHETPPEPTLMDDGGIDFSEECAFLRKRLKRYQTAALDVTNRVLEFFKYEMSTPLVRLIPRWEHALHNPIWITENGQELRGGTHTIVAQPVPGVCGEFGVKRLTPSDIPALSAFLSHPSEASLVKALLSDAQTAWFERSLRRSVLELAICTEVMVKRHYFAATSPAGAAFDYLEDKSRVSVRILELIDPVALEAFGQSFRNDHPDEYREIDHLFRCRNKVAHRGELSYRADSASIITVDSSTVKGWWHAVALLKKWLESA